MYWRISNLLACVVTILTFTLSLAVPNDDDSIGVSLGIDEITSAYVTENGDFITVATVETTQSWKDFAIFLHETNWDSAKSHKYTDSEVNQFLITELSSIKKETEAKLGREIEITGITSPDFLSQYGYKGILIETASQIQPDLKGGAFAWSYLHNIRLAHNLNNAESLGYPAGTNIDLENNHLLHFDYQNKLLKVSITDIGINITNVMSHFRIPDFGGDGQNASSEKLKLLSIRTKKLVDSVLAGTTPHYGPAELSDFRRIIFSGDAPASEFENIRELIVNIFPEFGDRFVKGIEPRWAGAVGAARLARLYKYHPELFRIEVGYGGVDEHDEL